MLDPMKDPAISPERVIQGNSSFWAGGLQGIRASSRAFSIAWTRR